MSRDITESQFDAKCRKLGFVPQGFRGYYRLASADVLVSINNAGSRRRTQLAYLIAQDAKCAKPTDDYLPR